MSPTLLLDQDTHDLCLDAQGNIAVATAPYSQVQDASSAILTFLGECYYDKTLGVPYLKPPAQGQVIIGERPAFGFIRAKAIAAAKTVPGVTGATVTLAAPKGRALTGQVQITTAVTAAALVF